MHGKTIDVGEAANKRWLEAFDCTTTNLKWRRRRVGSFYDRLTEIRGMQPSFIHAPVHKGAYVEAITANVSVRDWELRASCD